MELTQEYFDKGLGNLMDKMGTLEAKIGTLENKMGTVEANMATKDDLAAQTKELKQYTTDAFEVQQEWMDERFKEMIVKYDVRDRVEKLERQFRDFKLKGPIHA